MKKLLLCLMLTGCASVPYKAGSAYTAPVGVPLAHAQSTVKQVLISGAKPGDVKVQSIAKDLTTAQIGLVVLTKQVDGLSKDDANAKVTIAAKNHRIFIDDIIFGIPIAILGGMVIFNLAKVFML